MIEILDPGVLTTVQDGGRHGYASLGVPLSGGFDLGALRAANHLLGNPADAALLEITFGGLQLRVHRALTVACAGAPCPGLDHLSAVSLRAGSVLRLGRPTSGVRTYLAVHGGLDVPAVLGSSATDTLSGLGPAPLAAGDRLTVGLASTPIVGFPAAAPFLAGEALLPITLGPRDDWFANPSQLLEVRWTVRADSDRVGVRLDGPPLRRSTSAELPSEGLRPGAVQVPPEGRPIVLGPDAPVTGGYPVIGVVSRAGLDRAAQLRPGDTVRFSARAGISARAGGRAAT